MVVFLLATSAVALAAPPWSDAPDSWWSSTYGVSAAQVGDVADGFDDGTFCPTQAVTRGQFAKMAVNGLDLPLLDPVTPSFLDVARGSTFYEHIEGACSEGIINGYGTGSGKLFRPNSSISRQQTNSILARYLSELELATSAVIQGKGGKTYGSLQEWYLWEGAFEIGGFLDYESVAPDHLATTAYLIFHSIVEGSDGYLRPAATLNRAQAAVLILRVSEAAMALTTPPKAPVLTSTYPTSANVGNWCTDPTPIVEGTAIPLSEVYVFNTDGATWVAAGYADSTGHVSLRVQIPLSEGRHELVARVRTSAGLFSSASNALVYGLDTQPPMATITRPVDAGIYYTDSLTPPFLADVADEAGVVGAEASGTVRVDFLYAPWSEEDPPATWDQFTLISSALTAPYEAIYPWQGLLNGHYLFAVRATDAAGNVSLLFDGPGYAAGATQQVVIDDGSE
jgi:hypothetical protein